MLTNSKQEIISANEIKSESIQKTTANEIVEILQEADKSLLAGFHTAAHSGIRLAITELTATS